MTDARLGHEERVALGALVATFVVTAAWWLLALWPVADAPNWLERTRYVCFGIGESGLPDAGGWIGLIGGPAGMLAIVVAGWGGAMKSLVHAARRSFSVATTLALLALGTLLLGMGASLRVRQARALEWRPELRTTARADDLPRLDRTAPPLRLLAHDGVERSLDELHGRVVLLTFAYAHCETVCPVVVRDVLDAQRIAVDKDGRAPVVLVVTLDPWRDTPARLPAIARDWKFPPQDAWLLGGSVAQVERVLTAWNIARARNEQNGEVTHPAVVFVLDQNGKIAFAASGGAETLAALVRRI